MSRRWRRLEIDRLTGPAAYLALAAAATLVVVLGLQNRALREQVRELEVRAERAYPGLTVPAFRAATLAGDSVGIGTAAAGRRQVLFIFDTRCGWCLRTVPVWNDIAAELRDFHGDVDVFGISTDGEEETRDYALREGLAFPVLRFPDPRLTRLYRVVGVPLTLVLDHEGRVIHARDGSLERAASVDSILAAAAGEIGASERISARR